MTIREAINGIDELKPNDYTQSEKVKWLSALDGMVQKELYNQYLDSTEIFGGYNDSTDEETVLLIPAPYEEAYLTWLESKIDYHNSEIGKYNNSAMRFNDIFESFKKDYNRTHTHKSARITYF